MHEEMKECARNEDKLIQNNYELGTYTFIEVNYE